MKWSPTSIRAVAARSMAELDMLGAQVFMTGADPATFAGDRNACGRLRRLHLELVVRQRA